MMSMAFPDPRSAAVAAAGTHDAAGARRPPAAGAAPRMLDATTSVVRCNGVDIAYESIGDDDAPTLLLVMGLGMQLHGWPDGFCRQLAGCGFRVVRFDNRDSGLSTKIAWPRVDVPRAVAASWLGMPVKAPYGLDDMAADAVGLLDALGIAQAGVIGASMGGMIAQVMAARHPQRVRRLVSIMSTSGNSRVSRGRPAAAQALLSRPADPRDPESVVAHMMKVHSIIGSPRYPTDPALLRERFVRSVRRGYDRQATARQFLAILASGDRRRLLAQVAAPTLVIHGADDPLVPVAGGRDTAEHIAGARLLVIDGMGHDLPEALFPQLVDAIAAHCA